MAGYREFQTGEVLTAANVNDFLMNQSVMVFADSSARDTALGTAVASGNALVEGMLTYNKATGALEVYDGSAWSGVGGSVKKIAAFTASGTWTVPAGVTYAIAHMLGGGGGIGASTTGGDAAASSVAFASGTVSSAGGKKVPFTQGGFSAVEAGSANSGRPASMGYNGQYGITGDSGHAQWIVAGADVTPAASITVTVGAGGAAGTSGAAGGSGYVYIEYYE